MILILKIVAISAIATPPYFCWILMFFFFGALPIDQWKIKHTEKLKAIPSRHFLENLPEKASMYAFIHLKLSGNLQGFWQ